ncbi:MAG: AAA family ATPase [Rhizobiaceae bacterium]|nr:AAA family ATPase [Alphaproteobacteria bacterium]MCB1465591.1 AAA family ATPase [Rhizobiaceae bacterium]
MTNDHGGQHVFLSDCSGCGQSTLLTELASRGFETVEEPGRKIVLQELNGAGVALRWVDLEAFARRAIDMETGHRNRVAYSQGWVFFDRCVVRAAGDDHPHLPDRRLRGHANCHRDRHLFR